MKLGEFLDSIQFRPHATIINSWDSFGPSGDVLMQLWSAPGQRVRDHAVAGAYLRVNCYDAKEFQASGHTVPVGYAGRRRAMAAGESGARGYAAISSPPNGEHGPGLWAKHADLSRVFLILALERTAEGDVFAILGTPVPAAGLRG